MGFKAYVSILQEQSGPEDSTTFPKDLVEHVAASNILRVVLGFVLLRPENALQMQRGPQGGLSGFHLPVQTPK